MDRGTTANYVNVRPILSIVNSYTNRQTQSVSCQYTGNVCSLLPRCISYVGKPSIRKLGSNPDQCSASVVYVASMCRLFWFERCSDLSTVYAMVYTHTHTLVQMDNAQTSLAIVTTISYLDSVVMLDSAKKGTPVWMIFFSLLSCCLSRHRPQDHRRVSACYSPPQS